MEALTFEDIEAARERIRDQIAYTPCKESRAFDDLIPCRLHFKLENFQHTGSFKDRGSLNRILALTEEEKLRGVITASAGNHAQAVAYHASRFGIPATVVMPEATPLIKVSNTRRYGAEVILKGQRFDDAVAEAHRLMSEEGFVLIHAFDDPWVIAGQGSIGLELMEQVPELNTVAVPIGGGGLISGIAVAVKHLNPSVRVVGVEAAAAPSARASREAGEIVEIESADTLADGIAVKRIGDLTFPLVEKYVDDIVVVTEEEIATAIVLLLEREKTVVEGAGAAGVAALLAGKIDTEPDEMVVPIVCGGNIDINMVSRIIDRGLVLDGRLIRLRVNMPDRPGSLVKLIRVVAGLGANVMEIYHQRAFADISVGNVEIVMQVETRGRAHVEEIVKGLGEEGVRVVEEM